MSVKVEIVTRFTKGEWKFVKDCGKSLRPYGGTWSIRLERDQDGNFVNKLIATIPKHRTAWNRGEAEANAVLIETAPELYSSLEEAAHEMCHQNGLRDDLKCDFWDEDMKLCRNQDGKCFVQKWLKVLRKARRKLQNEL